MYYTWTSKRISDRALFSNVYIILFFFFLAKLPAFMSLLQSRSSYAVCIIIYSVYFVSHTDYTNIRKTYACVLSAEKCARIPGDNQSTTTQRFRGSGGGIRPLRERPRNTYIGSDSPHETKQKRPFPVSFHTYIYNIRYSRAGRPIKPMQTCLHRIFKEGFIHILFSRNEIYTKLCTHQVYAYVCVRVCFNVNVYRYLL